MVRVGLFRCHPSHPAFAGQHYYHWHHMIVFPRTLVELTQIGREKIIGSPNIAIFYNHGTLYERKELTEQGDQCDFFQFNIALLYDILSEYDFDARSRETEPFLFTHSYVSRENFMHQRQMIDLITRLNPPDALCIDEMAVELLASVIADSCAQRGIHKKTKQETLRTHRQLAFDAQKLLVTRYDERLTLQQLADEFFVSPYHLNRVFRQQMGCTLHRYLEQLRLRIAHERLGDYSNNLTHLAIDVGYSTHSHFTEAFRRNFGYLPSQTSKVRVASKVWQLGTYEQNA